MVSGITGVGSTAQDQEGVMDKTKELGRDDFLTMFMAQLKYQDPLNPMDGQEFSAQLAQFSSLEQLYNVNENLETMKKVGDQNARLQSMDFIGKEIVAEGNTLSLSGDEEAKAEFTIERKAYCSISIKDQAGNPLKSMFLGVLDPGSHSFRWDGLDARGERAEEGVYRFEITALTEEGEPLAATTRIVGQVDRINMEGAGTVLYVGDMAVDASSVIDVRNPSASWGNEIATSEEDGFGADI